MTYICSHSTFLVAMATMANGRVSLELFEAIDKYYQTHVQIAKFTFCLNFGFNLNVLKQSLVCLNNITRSSFVDKNGHFIMITFVRIK